MEEICISVNDEMLHSVQLVDTRMVSLHCDVKTESIEEGNVKTNIFVSSKGKIISDNLGESVIQIKIVSEIFEMDITHSGSFKKNEEIEVSEKVFEKFLATQGIRLLWSFARENVYEITCKMLRKPIMLPTLDVMKAIKK